MMKKRLKTQKEKIHMVFDEEKRKEFLGGFHRRKIQRRKKAQEDLKQKWKEEKKKIRQNNDQRIYGEIAPQVQEAYKKLVSYRAMPELKELLQTEYEEEGHTVSILELNITDLERRRGLIGEKEINCEEENIKKECNTESKVNTHEIPGMELKEKFGEKEIINEDEESEEKSFQSATNIKKIIRRNATRDMQKSEVFQQKQKLEKQKNRKKVEAKTHVQRKIQKEKEMW